jgi:hypothetical protein
VHKIFLIASFLFILANSIFAIELNTEVVISRLPGKTQLENDQEMLLLGKEQIIKEYLKLKSLDSEVYFSKVKSMNLSLEKYNEFISSFFSKTSVVRLAGIDAKSSASNEVRGIFRSEFNDNKFADNYFDLIEDLNSYKSKRFYYDLEIDLLNNGKWLDLGVFNQESFTNVIMDSWLDLFNKNIVGFESIERVDGKYKKVLDQYSNRMNSESLELKLECKIKKAFENANTNKSSFEINAHYLLINSKSRETIYSFDFSIQKKEISNLNKKELSSAIASLIYNMIKVQIPNINDAIEKIKNVTEFNFELTGQQFFSDITNAQLALDKYLAPWKAKVQTKQLGLKSTIFTIKVENQTQEALVKFLKLMEKSPLTNDIKEKKFLIFNSENNSFAIVQKD